MAKVSDLSDDIIIEIMSWLPPESLLRSTCVQKSWYILIKDRIKDPKFVAKHLNHSKNESTASSLIFKSLTDISMGSLTLYNDIIDQDNERYFRFVVEDFKPLLPKHDDAFGNVFTNGISHCNGIVCIVDHVRCHVLLCNPTTRETKLLPNPYFPEMEEIYTVKIGLGYDCTANVYKVVRVCEWFFNFKAQVYTLGDDAWRDVILDQVEITDDYPLCTVFHMYCKGFYYWLVTKHDASNQYMIHSFDMHNEEFHTISLPDIFQSFEYRFTCYTSLTEWNESVVLLCYPMKSFVSTKPIEMWVMHKSFEGNKNSEYWTKYLSIRPEGNFQCPIIFLNSEELLITAYEKGLLCYNIRTSKFWRIHKGNIAWLQAIRYVKSLVSVNGNTVQ
ncbi:hypothetical protein TIFTF001_012595 [Ficus carica]|uniref:F-box domain-containing protein n=1 Tax=Ficus carica TaxID=3494 RepID=A0AA88A098_FICCA|nr:hypothetical protein TIFTF001_012595 [Ficus carica]